MLDFLIYPDPTQLLLNAKKGEVTVEPDFEVKDSNDLMIRGGDFYAIWVEDRGWWSTKEQDAVRLIDKATNDYITENAHIFTGVRVKALYMRSSRSGVIDKWHKYCKEQMWDSYHALDEKLIFANTKAKKRDYASKCLNYPLEEGETPAYEEIISTLYSPEERAKIEWSIGSIVTGDSKKLQKFMVLYGAAGTGKSTILNIIQKLFDGYDTVFDAKSIGSTRNSFALEPFVKNPLVAIQHDGDLSRIEDNTMLNSLVSHEMMLVNMKYKSAYPDRFKAFLFMGTNRPVKITDAKSGLLRRLIDVSPSGNKVHHMRYIKLMKQIEFELGGIAYHCKQVYLEDPHKYDDYVPMSMLGASNDFYNFVFDYFYIFKREDKTTAKVAWEMYKTYCAEANVPYPFSYRVFKEELKNYFKEYYERGTDDARSRNLYVGFRTDIFEDTEDEGKEESKVELIKFTKRKSIFDEIAAEYPAQYASDKGTPMQKWKDVTSTLSTLDTSQLHYVKVPKNHIVIDFDIPDEEGNKSFERNLAEASKWPETYAELSKSGGGIHLHYIYDGDVSKLERLYADHIEIKVFNGNSSLRRLYSKSNGVEIATINSGLPLKGEKEVVDVQQIKSERGLRKMIARNLAKDIHPGTKPSIEFIKKILDDAYASGLVYDVSDMENDIRLFASGSTHHPETCHKMIDKMKFKSEVETETIEADNETIIFYDVEVFPNLFLVNWKFEGEGRKVVRMINPTPMDIEKLIKFKLVGFNCRRYDNHILYGRLIGYSNEELYDLSNRIISGDRSAFFGEAYNLSYTDVYDFSSKKQSLKKFEIELGIHHQELGLPWDQPVDESLWEKVAEYCDNDVIATEAVFNARKSDWTARRVLAEVAGMTPNDTTNSLTTRIIFGKDRKPQGQFNYRNLAEPCEGKPNFPGYIFERGKSTYRGEEVGEGGYVYSEPGMYGNVALLDIASMHPTSVIQEQLFGEYTKRFEDIVQARLAIKHKDFERARGMLNGALSGYLEDPSTAKDLAQALKIAINSVYGLTSAKFENPFRDPRNIDNIVAKRGALFMIDLKHAVQEKGYVVAHIKTDSIKIPDADQEIIDFVTEFGASYGYTFEHEATYDRLCLVNDAVYIAKDKADGHWTATGTQFQVPYVFKSLFSKEPIEFDDLCETKSVTSSLYLTDPEDENNHIFVGKVGRFCPMKKGGKILHREKDGKFSAATGSKGYLWTESEVVKQLGREDDIDISYYEKMAQNAIETISKYGDYEWFVSDDPYISPGGSN